MSLDFESVKRSLLKESDAGEAAEASLEKTYSDEEEAGDEAEAKKDNAEFSNESRHLSLRMLFEQEDEDEEEEEEEGEGEEDDADTKEEKDEEEDEKEEEEAVEEVTPQETAELGKSVDDALESVLVDYESKARKSAAIQVESRYSLRKYLINQSNADLDVDKFTTDVARLVMNYDTLLDMEAIIVNKAIQFLTIHYNKELAEEFLELLDIKHGIVIGEEEEFDQPLAAGAFGGGGGA